MEEFNFRETKSMSFAHGYMYRSTCFRETGTPTLTLECLTHSRKKEKNQYVISD